MSLVNPHEMLALGILLWGIDKPIPSEFKTILLVTTIIFITFSVVQDIHLATIPVDVLLNHYRSSSFIS